MNLFIFSKYEFTVAFLILFVISCDGTSTDSAGAGATASLWTEKEVKDGTALCKIENELVSNVDSYCSCLIGIIDTKWPYDEYTKNKIAYDKKIVDDGTVEKCKRSAEKSGSTGEKAPSTTGSSVSAATNLIISPEVNGIPSSYDTIDKKIYFTWTAGRDSEFGVRDYTLHRYDLPKCTGLSIDTATILGTSVPFDGEEGKTYSFKISTYNSAGIIAESECSNDLTIDTIPPKNTSISIAGGSLHTNTATVNLGLSAVDAIEMYITNTAGCGSNGLWEAYRTEKNWELAQNNATAAVYVMYKDTAGNTSACISDTIIHDNLPPTSTSISINGDAAYATSTNVTLTLAATGASEMYVTNTDGCGSGGSWESYAATKSWTLGQTNSAATVYVKFKDTAGNTSACISDTIIHDNLPPTSTSISINGGANYVTTSTVALTLAATGASQLYLTNTAGCTNGGSWQTFVTSTSWSLGQANATATVYAKFKDAAGNESSCISDTIIHDSIAPSSASISIYSGAASSGSTRPVTLTINATGASGMYITNTAGCSSGGSLETYSTTKEWTLNQVNGAATIHVKFLDSAGNESTCVSGTTNLGWSTTTLSQDRASLAATTVGTKAFFAGGLSSVVGGDNRSNLVEIYDSSSNIWSTATLSQARNSLVAATVGTKAIFAGGSSSGGASNVVDIYDSSSNTWSTATLSQARHSLGVTTIGTKIIFAGGYTAGGAISNVVDIYNSSSNTWSTATLSQERLRVSATTVGTKAIFAGGQSNGGASNVVDIYDSSSNTWSTATLSQARFNLAATTVGTKAIFAGGDTAGGGPYSNVVDIYDSSSNTWSTSTTPLSQARSNLSATTVGTKALFAGGDRSGGYSNVVDIYDSSSNTWSTGTLSQARQIPSATTVGTKVIFAGGYDDGTGGSVYSNVVDIYVP